MLISLVLTILPALSWLEKMSSLLQSPPVQELHFDVMIDCTALLQLLETCKKQDKEECAAAIYSALVALQSLETRVKLCLQLQNMKRLTTHSEVTCALEY